MCLNKANLQTSKQAPSQNHKMTVSKEEVLAQLLGAQGRTKMSDPCATGPRMISRPHFRRAPAGV